MNDTEKVALAALLYELDKFRQRTVGKAILNIPFATLDDDKNVQFVVEAERIASRVGDQSPLVEEQPPAQSTPYLEAVTHRISVPRGEKQHNTSTRGPRYYPLQPLNLLDAGNEAAGDAKYYSNVFPVRAGEVENRSVTGGYDRLWQLFLAEVARLPQTSLRGFLDSLVHLMRKYLWCVPSGEQGAGISHYDYSRVVAAIAVCLSIAERENSQDDQAFLLIEGSLSGIQRFIYNPALNGRELQAGIANRLRGRSLYVTLMVKTIADYLSERVGLCSLNTLWATGGYFLIIAPNTGQTRDSLVAAREKVQRWLWGEYQGALGVSIIDLAVARDQLHDFGLARQQLDKIRAQAKLQQFKAPLSFVDQSPGDSWVDPWTLKTGDAFCVDTGRDLFSKDREISDKAQSDRADTISEDRSGQSLLFDLIGRTLVSTRTLQLRRSAAWTEMTSVTARLPRTIEESERLKGQVNEVLVEFPSLDRVWLLSDQTEPHQQADLCLHIADHHNKQIEFLRGDPQSGVAQGFELMATAVKTMKDKDGRGETIVRFQELAERSRGAKYLGILRMDIDDLGHIFGHGLRNEENSIARIANLSQMLDWFFAGYLNTLVSGKDIDIVYAGGDDLFVLGAWDQVLELAENIQQRFRDFCGNNPDLHISGSLGLCHGRYPLARAAENAGETLESIAKTPAYVFRDRERRRHRIEGDSDKDAFAFLEKKISWRKWREVRSLGDKMVEACDTGKLSRRFVSNLLELYRSHIDPRRDLSREFSGEDLIWLPRFKFSLVNNVRDAQLRAYLIRAIEQNKYYLSVLAGYVLLRTRGRFGNRKEEV